MPSESATTLRGALKVFGQRDLKWLETVDRQLGRVLSGTDSKKSRHALFGWIDDPVLGRILKIQFRDGGASPRTGVHVVDVAADGRLGGFDGVFDDNVDNYPYHCDVRKSGSSSSFFASCEYDFCNIYDYLDGAIPVCWDPAHAQEICWYQLAR